MHSDSTISPKLARAVKLFLQEKNMMPVPACMIVGPRFKSRTMAVKTPPRVDDQCEISARSWRVGRGSECMHLLRVVVEVVVADSEVRKKIFLFC